MELTNKISSSAGDDGNDALLKAVGALAQVIYLATDKRRRNDTISGLVTTLRLYLEMLDTMGDAGAAMERPH